MACGLYVCTRTFLLALCEIWVIILVIELKQVVHKAHAVIVLLKNYAPVNTAVVNVVYLIFNELNVSSHLCFIALYIALYIYSSSLSYPQNVWELRSHTFCG
jgi:hypothetical protein